MKQKLSQRQQEHDKGVKQRLGDRTPPKHRLRPPNGRDLNRDQEGGGLVDVSDLGSGR